MQYSRFRSPPGSDESEATGDKLKESSATQVLVLSSIQVAMGLLCVVLATVLVNMNLSEQVAVERTGYGIWIGVYYVLAGSVGIAAAKRKDSCLITATMILNIVCSALWSLLFISLSSAGLAYTTWHGCSLRYLPDDVMGYMEPCDMLATDIFYTFESLMLLMAIAEFVITIWCAALCCGAVCRCCKPAPIPTQVIQWNTTPTEQNGQVIILSNPLVTSYTSAPTSYPTLTYPTVPVHQPSAASDYYTAATTPMYSYSWGTASQLPQGTNTSTQGT